MDTQKLSDAIENFGSGFTNLSLIGMASQSVWPVQGFVMPVGVTKAAFWCAICGFAIRTLSKPIAQLIAAFKNGKAEAPPAPPTQ